MSVSVAACFECSSWIRLARRPSFQRQAHLNSMGHFQDAFKLGRGRKKEEPNERGPRCAFGGRLKTCWFFWFSFLSDTPKELYFFSWGWKLNKLLLASLGGDFLLRLTA